MFALLLMGVFAIAARLSVSTSEGGSVSMGEAVAPDKVIPPPRLQREQRYVAATMKLEDPEEIERRAKRIKRRYPRTAQIMMERALKLRDSSDSLKSPIRGVDNGQWTSFARALSRTKSDLTPSNHIGIFSLAFARLAKMGKATNLRKMTVEPTKDGGKARQVWTADLIAPLTVEGLLKSPSQQYALFVESMRGYLPDLTKLASWTGKKAEGQEITRSGILALLHKGGFDGARAWLSNPSERSKYPNTTAAFSAATEIF